jgi:hypothetical protein
MPRIPDGALDGIIYLYASRADAENGERTGGSGFLITIPADVLPGLGTLYAVTNAHVIEDGFCTIRLNTKDGKSDIFEFTELNWIKHRDGDDIAVCHMPQLRPEFHKYSDIDPTTLLKRHEVAEFRVGPGDDAFVVGRFINSQGKLRNIPSVRFGNIAQMPIEPIEQRRNFGIFKQESFLVEARSISGFSGSPVFLLLLKVHSRQDPSYFLKTDVFRLLGVQWGYILDWEPVCDEFERPVDTKLQVRQNTGMMGVVPAWKLEELLYREDLVNHRTVTEEEYKRRGGARPQLFLPPAKCAT